MRRLLLVPSLFVLACSSSEGETPGKDDLDIPVAPNAPEGLSEQDGNLFFATGEFHVPAGEERFLCYAVTIDRDLEIDAYAYAARPSVHHFVFARTTTPEPEGFSECEVLFKASWLPLFISATSNARLPLPEGTAQKISAGTQLVIQLHLLNSGTEDVTDRAMVAMSPSELPDAVPAGVYALGSTRVQLPPNSTSTVVGECTTRGPVELFAMMPHMHYLGRRLVVEAGPTMDALEVIYERDPYDFDDQSFDLLDVQLPGGWATRTTCTYENDRDETITFGESSLNEMCFAIGYGKGIDGASGCISSGGGEEVPRDPSAGECADVVPNDKGIGTQCTEGGGECPSETQCSADLQQTESGTGVCLSIGCSTKEECGGGSATCCNYGIVDLCIPEACRPLTCAPKE